MVRRSRSTSKKNKSMAAFALFGMLMQPAQVFAQGMMTNSGPIDIQADEQEFGEGHVVAKGRVRVKYKDSIVTAPMATLYRDPAGQPQRAVFTGHPHLVQGLNRIDADVLVFEINSQKIIADGHAHSEVLQDAPLGSLDGEGQAPEAEEDMTSANFGAKKADGKAAPAPVKVASRPKNALKQSGKNGSFAWPTKAGDASSAKDAPKEHVAEAPKAPPKPKSPIVPRTAADDDLVDAAGNGTPQLTTEQLLAPPVQSAAAAKEQAAAAQAKKPDSKKPAEKIITDSRYQEYNRATGRFEAKGDVHVRHGDILVLSDRLQLVYGTDAKPESALFTGHVNATQNENNTQADAMTYFLATQRLQATGNVRSKVIQKKGDGPKKGGPDAGQEGDGADKTTASSKVTSDTTAFTSSSKKYVEPDIADSGVEQFSRPAAPDKGVEKAGDKPVDKTKVATASDASKKGINMDLNGKNDEPIFIDSDAQDYNKDTGRIAAQGNVKVRYGQITGAGQNVVLIRNADGQAEKVVFTGRSQIIQPGKRWIGDKITMMVNDRRVLAQGNTRAYILQTPGQESGIAGTKPKPKSGAAPLPASTMPPNATSPGVAGKPPVSAANPTNSQVSASKIEATK